MKKSRQIIWTASLMFITNRLITNCNSCPFTDFFWNLTFSSVSTWCLCSHAIVLEAHILQIFLQFNMIQDTINFKLLIKVTLNQNNTSYLKMIGFPWISFFLWEGKIFFGHHLKPISFDPKALRFWSGTKLSKPPFSPRSSLLSESELLLSDSVSVACTWFQVKTAGQNSWFFLDWEQTHWICANYLDKTNSKTEQKLMKMNMKKFWSTEQTFLEKETCFPLLI